MKKKNLILLSLISTIMLSACGNTSTVVTENENTTGKSSENDIDIELRLKIKRILIWAARRKQEKILIHL